MSLITFALDGILGLLLISALFLGWRLDRRLKALRDSHAGFAQAVADLDRAAQRAEQGLADLRMATDEAAEVLAARIDKAKTLSMKLDGQTSRLEEAAANPILREPRETSAAAARPRAYAEARPVAPMPAPSPARSRARIDDDLFDEPAQPRLRSILGGR